jgi:alpha-tubulin suppressor-like RCC1 family protein
MVAVSSLFGVASGGSSASALPTSAPLATLSPLTGIKTVDAGELYTCVLTEVGGVKCWGWGEYGQLGDGSSVDRLTPVDVTGLGSGAQAVSAGGHACVLTDAGGVKCWGWNSEGQLGDGSLVDRLTPVDVTGLGSGVRAVSAGLVHTCAVMETGGVKCWGRNSEGQLGDGTLVGRLTPVDVIGLGSGVRAISAGGGHTCALTETGGIKCWGWHSGDGSSLDRLTPVDVTGLGSGVQAVSAGADHTCALTDAGGVKCWGFNGDGRLGDGTAMSRLAPVNVNGLGSSVQAISVGVHHTCALTDAGGVKCWGRNVKGGLGDGTTSARLTPVDVIDLGSGVQAISAGFDHTCAVTDAGGVKCWGWNEYGQLVDGTSVDRLTPVDVIGLGDDVQDVTGPSSGVQAVSAGEGHTCALTDAGGVKCWGGNGNGQLGAVRTSPQLTSVVDVTGLSSRVQVVSAGGYHTCALTDAGGVKCWGWNSGGRLGDGTTTQRLTPVDVIGLSSVQAISAGYDHTCALTGAGGVKCWGPNSDGELGDGTTTQRLTPVDVIGLSSGVQAISAGWRHTCALTDAGGVKCWGRNFDGVLGDGTWVDRLTPIDVIGFASGVRAISAGHSHTCALTDAGGVTCWGGNRNGQLGAGAESPRSTPGVDVIGLNSGVQAISAAELHTCALMDAGGVKCWGWNFDGQLGDGTTSPRLTPVDVVGLSTGVRAVSAGFDHTCAVTDTGGVKCWGNNRNGVLGGDTPVHRPTPVDVIGLSSSVQAISAGSYHTCALTGAGAVKCWGSNGGQLGDGTPWPRLTPVDVHGLGSGVQAVSAGHNHTCALTDAGGVKCWGSNEFGEVGDGSSLARFTPVDVTGLSSGVQAVSAGYKYSCALMDAGGVKCWGWNEYGQLGDGTTETRLTPVDVIGLSSGVKAITAGSRHTCALTDAGIVKCWGGNFRGELGDGTTAQRVTPVDVIGLGNGAQAISAEYYHTCALTGVGGAKCWGSNEFGELGDGTTTLQLTPVDVVGLGSGVQTVSAGSQHSCALTDEGGVKCWGANGEGQLGDGTSRHPLIPFDVIGLGGGEQPEGTTPTDKESRVVLFIQGINTFSRCPDGAGMTAAYAEPSGSPATKTPAPVWLKDFLSSPDQGWVTEQVDLSYAYFSYSGNYCDHLQGDLNSTPEYESVNTCQNFSTHFENLKRLVTNVTRDGKTRVTLVGWSQGGYIASYFVGRLREEDPAFLVQRVASVVTFDSFPGGMAAVPVLGTSLYESLSVGCGPGVFLEWLSWTDVARQAKFAARSFISGGQRHQVRFYTINATGAVSIPDVVTHITGETLHAEFSGDHLSIWDTPTRNGETPPKGKEMFTACGILRVTSCFNPFIEFEPAGVVQPLHLDTDSDGIIDVLDDAPDASSSDFSDTRIGGGTAGKVLVRGGGDVSVTDALFGFYFAANGGSIPAVVQLTCPRGLSIGQEIQIVFQNTRTGDVHCGSAVVPVVEGSADVSTTIGGIRVSATVLAGQTLTYSLEEGGLQIAAVGGGGLTVVSVYRDDALLGTVALGMDDGVVLDPATLAVSTLPTNPGIVVAQIGGAEFQVSPGSAIGIADTGTTPPAIAPGVSGTSGSKNWTIWFAGAAAGSIAAIAFGLYLWNIRRARRIGI